MLGNAGGIRFDSQTVVHQPGLMVQIDQPTLVDIRILGVGDPILTQSLMAVGEDDHYEHHDAPQKALLALADIFHSHDNATFQARSRGACVDDFATVQPGHMAYLLQVIARGMKMEPCALDAARSLREVREQMKTEGT